MIQQGLNIRLGRTGAMGFDICIHASSVETQKSAMGELDALLDGNSALTAFPWSENNDVAISTRFLSGGVKETQKVLAAWLKICQQRFKGCNVEKTWQ